MGASPTYIAKARTDHGTWARVGAAWFNEKSKTISLQLDPFIQLPPGAKLTLYSKDSLAQKDQEE